MLHVVLELLVGSALALVGAYRALNTKVVRSDVALARVARAVGGVLDRDGRGVSIEDGTLVIRLGMRPEPSGFFAYRVCAPVPDGVEPLSVCARNDVPPSDVATGDDLFDRAFLVRGAPPDLVRRLLDERVRAELVAFGAHGRLEARAGQLTHAWSSPNVDAQELGRSVDIVRGIAENARRGSAAGTYR